MGGGGGGRILRGTKKVMVTLLAEMLGALSPKLWPETLKGLGFRVQGSGFRV